VKEQRAELLAEDMLSHEWEWEGTPEVTLRLVDDIDEATLLFNRYSPQFIACLVSQDTDQRDRFERRVNAAFIGDGQTRWVDGQKALRQPELGLSNWQNGRLFARGGVLSGDSVYTVRTRARRTS
jgi:glutamate-5-semialdehyde dehydrogenase